MTPENFVYWLNGYVELANGYPTPEQWKCIKEHLDLTLNKVTPQRVGAGCGAPKITPYTDFPYFNK